MTAARDRAPGLPNYNLGEILGTENITLATANLAPHDNALPAAEPGTCLLRILVAVGTAGA